MHALVRCGPWPLIPHLSIAPSALPLTQAANQFAEHSAAEFRPAPAGEILLPSRARSWPVHLRTAWPFHLRTRPVHLPPFLAHSSPSRPPRSSAAAAWRTSRSARPRGATGCWCGQTCRSKRRARWTTSLRRTSPRRITSPWARFSRCLLVRAGAVFFLIWQGAWGQNDGLDST